MNTETDAADRRNRLYGATRKREPVADPKISSLVDHQQRERAQLLEQHRGEMHKLEMKHSHALPQHSMGAAAPGPGHARQQESERKTLMAKHGDELSKLKKRHGDELRKARGKK